MTRIIPNYNVTTRKTIPKWIDTNSIIEAGNASIKKIKSLTKTASQPTKIVISYFCTPCNKVFQAGHPDFIKQATIANKRNKSFEPSCPRCGNKVTSYKDTVLKTTTSNLQSISQEKNVNTLDKEGSAKGMYNTFIDRRVAYEASEKLGKFARKNGMTACTARYLKSEYTKEAGNDISTFSKIDCSLEWIFGRNQRGRATATLKIDPAGKFEFPRVFKVASGMEYPFEEKFIRKLEKEPALFQSMAKRKKSDTPVYRKHDPTRFRVASMKVGEMFERPDDHELCRFAGRINKVAGPVVWDYETGDLNFTGRDFINFKRWLLSFPNNKLADKVGLDFEGDERSEMRLRKMIEKSKSMDSLYRIEPEGIQYAIQDFLRLKGKTSSSMKVGEYVKEMEEKDTEKEEKKDEE